MNIKYHNTNVKTPYKKGCFYGIRYVMGYSPLSR